MQIEKPKRYYITIQGEKHEVSQELYMVFYSYERKERYLEEVDQQNGWVGLAMSNANATAQSEVEMSILLHNLLHQSISALPEERPGAAGGKTCRWHIFGSVGKSSRKLAASRRDA